MHGNVVHGKVIFKNTACGVVRIFISTMLIRNYRLNSA